MTRDSGIAPGMRRSETRSSALSGSSQSSPSLDDETLWPTSWGTFDYGFEIPDSFSVKSVERFGVNDLAFQPFGNELLGYDMPILPVDELNSEEACWKRQTVLSLDGGGIRGLSELLILQEIMTEVARIENERDGTQGSSEIPRSAHREDDESISESLHDHSVDNFLPCHYFDFICGTSLGGVIAVLLGRLRCSVAEAMEYYKNIWNGMTSSIPQIDRMIPGSSSKDECTLGMGRALDAIIKDQQAQRQVRTKKGRPDDVALFRQSNERLCKTLVLAVQYDTLRHVRRPYLFRSYTPHRTKNTSGLNRNIDGSTCDQFTRDICLATSASPYYFRGHKIGETKFRDGSIWMSNPSMELYREIDSIFAEVQYPLHCFVSIGSGKQRKGRAERTLRPFSPGGFLRRKSVYDREQELVDEVLTRRNEEGQRFNYFRIEGPKDLPDVRPADWKFGSPQRIKNRITRCTKDYCETKPVTEQIRALARILVDNRRKRAKSSAWAEYVDIPITETSRHTCLWCSVCEDADRDAFIGHVRRAHPSKVRNVRCLDDYRGILRDSQIPTIVTIRTC
ncbi:acyl transferase/acyl hydrolase/lysophospholipase [Lophiotrema nucula]|uniref:Acyl transferase/acyl hydrolase/lysophospholipase n=1 Tax=Lophiotrema nucula TaxID=690887 RepID=A0A6A5YJV1_9PLEO|nr:acyl transferase/acyl hydrolase/lysophospholipase [Lophiotrema nucula]